MKRLDTFYRVLSIVDLNVLRALAAITSIALGIGFMFGPQQWHTSKTLYYVNILPIPFWIWGILFLVGGILLALAEFKGQERFRISGYLTVASLSLFFDICAWASLFWAGGTLLAPCSLLMVAILYWVLFKFAVFDKFDPDRRNVL